jgi:Fe-S cluster assembly iron-binding protein IscA
MNILAFHRMKYPNRITIKDVVINFKQACIPIKTDKQPFVFGIRITFKTTVIFNGIRLSFG